MIRATKKIISILTSKQKRGMIIIALMMLLGGVLESISVSLILPLVEAVMNETNWMDKSYAKLICNSFHITSQTTYVIVLLVMLILIFILKNAYLLLEYYVQFGFIARSRYNLQHSLMHSYLHKPYDYFLYASSGTIIRIVTNDTSQTFTLLTQLLTFYTEIVVAFILGLTILIISPKMALGLIVILLLELLVITKVIKPVLSRMGNTQRAEGAKANKWLLQSINGIKSVKVAHKEDFFENKYAQHADISVDMDRKNQTLQNLPRLVIEAFTVAAVLLWILIMLLTGTGLIELIPVLSAFVVAAVRILPSVNRITNAMNQIVFFEGGLDNVIEVLNGEKVLETQEMEIEKADIDISFDSSIDFQNVTFSYTEEGKLIFDDASFSIKPGESVGIVGKSGSGKTTAIDIILGLLKPTKGHVYSDGISIEKNMSSWLSKLAYIPQNIFLMDDTIRTNVTFGEHTSEVDDERVWSALRDAQLDEYVNGLPDGLDAIVGEQGVRLSGGQRQRIGIARALYNNPEILFFDEATSALDNDTESAIMESIENLKGKKTLVIIAHRLTTIENCDVVYRIEDGKVIKER